APGDSRCMYRTNLPGRPRSPAMKQTRAMPSIAPNGLPRLNVLPKRVYRWLGLGLLLAIGLTVGVALHWDERLYFNLTHAAPVAGAETTDRWLPDYRVLIEAKPVAGITRNLSAITYDRDLDRLLAVVNGGPTELV